MTCSLSISEHAGATPSIDSDTAYVTRDLKRFNQFLLRSACRLDCGLNSVCQRDNSLSCYLVRNTKALTLLHEFIISLPRQASPALAPLHNGQKRQNLSQPCKSCQNESVLISHVCDPWGNSIGNCKGHRIPDDNNGDHGFAAQVFVRVDAVGDTELYANAV